MSVVVVAHAMERELPRTLLSLDLDHQRELVSTDYEVIVVDNGSPTPVDQRLIESFAGDARLVRLDPAPASPAKAANLGLAEARGGVVGLIVDGARMASPGLLSSALLASSASERSIVASLGWHLGAARHGSAGAHDRQTEDELLASVDWEADGYRLFGVSVTANSSARGWLGPIGESSALFLPRPLWDELGGLEERFVTPGGGLVNHDLYRRACALPDSTLYMLLGEGTFHQYHGGASTGGAFTWDEMHEEYIRLRGEEHHPPQRPAVLIGHVPPAALEHLRDAVDLAITRRDRAGSGLLRKEGPSASGSHAG